MRAIVMDSHYKKLAAASTRPQEREKIDALLLKFSRGHQGQEKKTGVGHFNASQGCTARNPKEKIMLLGQRWLGRWRSWQQRHWCLGVDDSGDAVRWVCLHRQRGQPVSVMGAGLWAHGEEAVGMRQADLHGLSIALVTRAVVQRGQVLPDALAEEDLPAWVRAHMSAVMHVPPADLAVDWGFESEEVPRTRVWMAAVRASVMRQRDQWAQARGATLRILETPSSTLARVLRLSAQVSADPVWLWWAGRDEGQVCTGWWHLGQWHDRLDVPVSTSALGEMPGVLVNLVKSTQAHKSALMFKHWWWAGEPLAAWADQWAKNPPAACRDWHCQAAPMPLGRELEWLTQAPAHEWALAMGLALHPGWNE
jgi:hypothetical protein